MTLRPLAGIAQTSEPSRKHFASGALLIFRGEAHRRKPAHLALQVMGLLAGSLALGYGWMHAGLLHSGLTGGLHTLGLHKMVGEYADLLQLRSLGELNRMFELGLIAMPILFLPCAAVLGAMSAPTRGEEEKIQALFLTRLTPFDLAAGRIAAGLWPLWIAQAAYGLLWLTLLAANGFRSVTLVALLIAHCVVAIAVSMIGALAFLLSLRRQGGRAWARGAILAAGIVAVSVLGLFLINSKVRTMNDPTALIERALLVNPVVATGSAFKMDLLRSPFVYDRTDAPEYPFRYPDPLASAGLFGCIGAVTVLVSTARLRRMYR